jgi:hypothetical protein
MMVNVLISLNVMDLLHLLHLLQALLRLQILVQILVLQLQLLLQVRLVFLQESLGQLQPQSQLRQIHQLLNQILILLVNIALSALLVQLMM